MRGYFEAAVKWLASVVSEDGLVGSASRVAKLLVVVSSMAALLLAVWFKRDLPTPDQLKALAELVGVGIGAYAVGQVKEWVGSKKDSQ